MDTLVSFLGGCIIGLIAATVWWLPRVTYYKWLATESVKVGKEAIKGWEDDRNDWNDTRREIRTTTDRLLVKLQQK